MEKTAQFDQRLGVLVVPGERTSIASLVSQLDQIAADRGATPYAIARATGGKLTIGTVTRFFRGYRSDAERSRVADPEAKGGVRAASLLAILHALGLDLEIVSRQAPGRPDLDAGDGLD